MAKITRIATTVTARYFPGQGASDAFYLDGRLTGRRESRAADISLDREDRGSFFAVFAHQAAAGKDPQAEIAAVRPHLDRILNDVKKTGRNIDAEINELADCGVAVAGRMTLQHAGVRQPYFAGIVVKDQEIASITIGRGCSYLYRNDILYPLTDDEFEMEEIDAFGRPVEGLDMYCAGVAGTVRYSNIAQLQMDDCLIVCNREVMDALGQREVLRILYEAEDQCEAAGMIITEAAAKSPGASLQFMIGFVESATVADKSTRGSWIGKKAAAPVAVVPPVLSSLPVQPDDLSAVPAMFEQAPEELEEIPAEPFAPLPERVDDTEAPAVWEEEIPVEPAGDEFPALDIPDIQQDSYATESVMASARQRTPDYNARNRRGDVYPDPGDDEEDGDAPAYGRSRLGTYLLIAVVAVALVVALYLIFRDPKDPTPTTVPSGTTTVTGQTTPGTTAPTTSATLPSGQTTEPGQTTLPGQTTQAGPGTIDPATPKELPTTYKIRPGDTLYRIALYFYDDGSGYFVQLIRDANGMVEGDPLYVDNVLMIPAIPAATEPPATQATTTEAP